MFQVVETGGPNICSGILPFGLSLGSYDTGIVNPSSDANLLWITNLMGNTLISRFNAINTG
jgi:hypothetical protein